MRAMTLCGKMQFHAVGGNPVPRRQRLPVLLALFLAPLALGCAKGQVIEHNGVVERATASDQGAPSPQQGDLQPLDGVDIKQLPGFCGDNHRDLAEACDGEDFGEASCQTLGFAGGRLGCNSGCAIDSSDCTHCGNGSIDPGEACDGPALGGASCKSLGYTAGSLKCDGDCALDRSDCKKTVCGDDVAEGSEACDGTDLKQQSCKSLGRGEGILACAQGCILDTSGCVQCSDGVRGGDEECDGDDLAGATCRGLGYLRGELSCDSSCTFNRSRCVASVGAIVVSEFLANSKAVDDSRGEWIELFNADAVSVELLGWTLKDRGSNSHTIGLSLVIAPGYYAVLGREASLPLNGGVVLDYTFSDYFLSNDGDEILLYDGRGVLVDSVEYTGPWVADGASLSLVNPSANNTLRESWCVEALPWPGSAGDKGTPGAAPGCAAK